MDSSKRLVSQLALLLSAFAAASSACASALTPITPSVDHSKKATCGIKWTFDRKQAIRYFRIFRGTTGDFWSADCIAEVGNSTERFTDWGAAQYQNYFYWVIPYDYNANADALYDSSVLQNGNPSGFSCQNHRYWGSSDVYLTATVKSVAIGSTLPLYFKVNAGTSGDPLYDHVMPDRVVFTRMTDMDGNNVDDIARVFGNRQEILAGGLIGNSIEYAGPETTYLKGNGSFGYLVPYKPGILYLRAYYRSATTVSPLRIEIKKPTFNLYAPEGNVDIVDNNYRDLFLKCNGKFVCPDVERTAGDSATIWPVSSVETTDESQLQDGLYENSFGFLSMTRSGETTEFDISYNGMFVKKYRVSPVWDPNRTLKLLYWGADGTSVTPPFAAGETYYFGVAYGDRLLPHHVLKCGTLFLTDSNWGIDDATDGPAGFVAHGEPWSQYGELGSFRSQNSGEATISLQVFDRQVSNNTIIFQR